MDIVAKGYVNRPSTRESTKGTFSKFTLAMRQKNRDGAYSKHYLDVTDFENKTPPKESSFVTVSGYMKFRNYTKDDGTTGISYDVTAKNIEVSDGPPSKAETNEDPFAL